MNAACLQPGALERDHDARARVSSMQSIHVFFRTLAVCSVCLLLPACGNSNSGGDSSRSPTHGTNAATGGGGGFNGIYTSVEHEEMTIEFKAGGAVVMSAKDLGTSTGTYTTDGEKIIVSIDNQQHTFIRDGDCIEEGRNIFGKLCKGGKAGEASNVSSRNVPNPPTGTWIATNEDGEFKIEFKPDSKMTLFVTPKVGKPETHDGKFEIEGDRLFANVSPGISMVLKYVNNAYESNAFGLPMKFVKQ